MSLAYFLAANSPPADAVRHLYHKKPEGGWQLDISGLPLPADLPTDLPTDSPADLPADLPEDSASGASSPVASQPADGSEAAAKTVATLPSPVPDGRGAGTPLPHSGAAGPSVLARNDSRSINGALLQLARGEAVLAE